MNAIIMGGSKGVGLSITQKLAETHDKICIVSRNLSNLNTASNLSSNGKAQILIFPGDISNSNLPSELNDFLKHSNFGPVETLICNAGGPPQKVLLDTTDEDWSVAIQTLLLGQVRLVKSLIPQMIKNSYGRVIFISSTVVNEPSVDMILSATARAGLGAFAKAAAKNFANYNITFNVIHLGGVLTDRLSSLIENQSKLQGKSFEIVEKELVATIPAGRFASPDEISDLVNFLVSKKKMYITGSSILIDGGMTKGYF